MSRRSNKADQQAARVQRLRTALRDNLRRRKAQARGRARETQRAPGQPNRDETENKLDPSGEPV